MIYAFIYWTFLYWFKKDKEVFKCLFEYGNKKAGHMHYWKGMKQATTNFTFSWEKRNIALRALTLE